MITDPIGDLIARIKNGYLAGHKKVSVPYSGIKHQIAEILNQEKYLAGVETIGDTVATKQLKLTLRYDRKEPAVKGIKRVSKPGVRKYQQAKELKLPLSGLGTGIISTSQGVMTVKKAKDKNLGGELLLEVW